MSQRDDAGSGNLFLITGRLGPTPQSWPNDSLRSPQRARAFFALCPNDTDLEYFLMTLWASNYVRRLGKVKAMPHVCFWPILL